MANIDVLIKPFPPPNKFYPKQINFPGDNLANKEIIWVTGLLKDSSQKRTKNYNHFQANKW
jgi:hypothetical protein